MIHEINVPLMRVYLHHLRVTNPGEWRLKGREALLGVPGVVSVSNESADDWSQAVTDVVETALTNLVDSRTMEGQALESDLRALNAELSSTVTRVIKLRPQAETALEERLGEALRKLGEAGGGIAGDSERLGKEVAALLIKSDTSEELTRLTSHIGAVERRLDDAGPHGRALEFLLQEMQRELNTLASKTPLLEIVELALHGKGIVDRIREQVANVE
jgi:uncharacterized protein (TIGR00255 family)